MAIPDVDKFYTWPGGQQMEYMKATMPGGWLRGKVKFAVLSRSLKWNDLEARSAWGFRIGDPRFQVSESTPPAVPSWGDSPVSGVFGGGRPGSAAGVDPEVMRRAAEAGVGPPTGPGDSKYCTQCGSPAPGDANFCQQCGSQYN